MSGTKDVDIPKRGALCVERFDLGEELVGEKRTQQEKEMGSGTPTLYAGEGSILRPFSYT
jgi:hypothetical protein